LNLEKARIGDRIYNWKIPIDGYRFLISV
jgi:hypothetical protein